MIRCRKCGEMRNRSDFYPNRSSRSGLQSQCRLCYNAYRRRRYRLEKLGRPLEGFDEMTDDEFWGRVAARSRNQIRQMRTPA